MSVRRFRRRPCSTLCKAELRAHGEDYRNWQPGAPTECDKQAFPDAEVQKKRTKRWQTPVNGKQPRLLQAFACPQKPDTVLGQEWLDAGGMAAVFPIERLLVNDDAPGALPPPLPLALPDGQGREALDALYRFVAAIELTPAVAVHSQDRNGIVRFWNRACAELFGYQKGQQWMVAHYLFDRA